METGDGDAAPEEASAPKKPRPIRRFEVLALAQVLASFLVAAVAAGVLLSKDAGAFTGTALLAAVLALPLTALGLSPGLQHSAALARSTASRPRSCVRTPPPASHCRRHRSAAGSRSWAAAAGAWAQ